MSLRLGPFLSGCAVVVADEESAPETPGESDHLMRFVPLKEQLRHPDTNAFEGILNTAFRIRPCDDGGLSVTWVEHYGEKNLNTYSVAGAAFRDSLNSKRLPKSGYFAIGNVKECRETSLAYNKKIRIVVEPDGTNTGHVTIRRFSDDDLALLDALALEVFSEHVAVTDLGI